MSLREELAAQLQMVGSGLDVAHRVAFPAPTFDTREHQWLLLADECIRQMEWAHRCPDCDMHSIPDPLTLAPEDWKP